MTCGLCIHFLPSKEANQRAWLAGYGYCKAAPSVESRALFVMESKPCWLNPKKFKEAPRGPQ